MFIHYKKLLNSNTDLGIKDKVLNNMKSGCEIESGSNVPFVDTNDVSNAFKAMKKGKCHGIDGVSSEIFLDMS